MTPRQIHNFFRRLSADNPDPKTELIYDSPFELLIAVILSAQATDVSVNQATEKLFAVANTPEAMVKLGLSGIRRHIRTIGLFNNKAKNVLKTCEQLIEHHSSAVPSDREALESLPVSGEKRRMSC